MTLAAVSAALFTAGLVLLRRALVPAHPPLAAHLATLLTPPAVATRADPAAAGFGQLLADRVDPTRTRFPKLRADLGVAEIPVGRHLTRSLATGGLFAVLAGLVATAATVGGFTLPAGVLALGMALSAAGGALTPSVQARSLAAERRGELTGLLPGYLDLVGIELAAGESIEAALRHAARFGTGWGYTRICDALVRTGLTRQPAAAGLAELAAATGVGELSELADSLSLAAGQGAQIRTSLAARAAALRDKQLTAAETRAGRATEAMAFPLALLVAGFVVLIGYPALVGLAGGLGSS